MFLTKKYKHYWYSEKEIKHKSREGNKIGHVYANTTAICLKKFRYKDSRNFLLRGDYRMRDLCYDIY